MAELALHTETKRAVDNFMANPSHALLLIGPSGSGKGSLAQLVASTALSTDAAGLHSHPYVRLLAPVDGKAISIETIRELEHFLSLRVPNDQAINRVVVVEDSQLLSTEAQNALLKTVEEPPVATLIIFTAASEDGLLPTIVSRMPSVSVKRPPLAVLTEHFAAQGHSSQKIAQVGAISGGLPGLMTSLLEDADHPLVPATERARQLLQQSVFERLATVDELAKQKALCADVLFILQQMAQLRLRQATGSDFARWTTILRASYEAAEALQQSAQAKLALTKLMLELG